jgi:hypothetical protein
VVEAMRTSTIDRYEPGSDAAPNLHVAQLDHHCDSLGLPG